ncbi:MAG TPA: YetF domain-containing protein [Solirubrobacteraceae bacterium]|nr:YetF domain-containing protein [Solirubrobacteraceae bacterium]
MDLVFRAAVVFAFVFLVTRIVGRRQLSQLEPFDLILLVVIGDLVQQGVTQSDDSVTGALIVISTIALLSFAVSWVSFRSRKLRLVTEGEPIVLVQNGRVIERNMRRERITREDIEEAARRQQIISIADLRWAILEDDGGITCISR